MAGLKIQYIEVSKIAVPPEFLRTETRVEDDALRRSIEHGGVQQPLIALEAHDGSFVIVKGTRRMRVVRALGLPKVPLIVTPVPAGTDPVAQAKRIRFLLDEHRQDLFPSQRAKIISKLRTDMNLSNGHVAAYLGIDADSVTNWLAILGYIAPVRAAMDSEALTMQAARVFDGMSEHGQEYLWKHHAQEIQTEPGKELHQRLRAKYHPDKFPQFYRKPEVVKARLERKKGKRKSQSRPSLTGDEKRKMLASYGLKEVDLAEKAEALKQLEREMKAAIVPINAILQNPALRKLVTPAMIEELERFSEVY